MQHDENSAKQFSIGMSNYKYIIKAFQVVLFKLLQVIQGG